MARAAVPLAPATERPEAAVQEIADIVVPAFADLFALDLVRPGGAIERVVASYREADSPRRSRPAARVAGLDRRTRAGDGGGRSELTFITEESGPPRDADGSLLAALGMQSWVVAPVVVRGAAPGTITLAVGYGRRGYRPSDQKTIDDLAARCSVALNEGRLYDEAWKRRASRPSCTPRPASASSSSSSPSGSRRSPRSLVGWPTTSTTC